MSFDIPLHLQTNTPEARLIEAIVNRDQVSPAEAVRTALREYAADRQNAPNSSFPAKKPGELLFGLFSDTPELIHQISLESVASRNAERVKEFGD